MITNIKYRLECDKHWWIFDSLDESFKHIEVFEQCNKGNFYIFKITETVNEFNRVIRKTEECIASYNTRSKKP